MTPRLLTLAATLILTATLVAGVYLALSGLGRIEVVGR